MGENEKSSRVVTIRLDNYMLTEINQLRESLNIKSTSRLIKQAINSFIMMNPYNPDRPNPKMIISHNILSPLFSRADEELLEKMSQISFENRASDTEHINQSLMEHGIEICEYCKELVQTVITTIKTVFSSEGQNWFSKITYSYNDPEFVVEGEHDLGKNFSIFVRNLLLKMLQSGNYRLIQEDFGTINRCWTNKHGESNEQSIDSVKFTFSRKE